MKAYYSRAWRCYSAQYTHDGTMFTGHGETFAEAIYKCLNSIREYGVYDPEVHGL